MIFPQSHPKNIRKNSKSPSSGFPRHKSDYYKDDFKKNDYYRDGFRKMIIAKMTFCGIFVNFAKQNQWLSSN